MPQKRLTTNGNVFRRTDGRWQSVIWYFDEQGVKRRKVFSSKTKTEAQQKITNYIAQFNAEVHNSDESQKTLKDSLTHWLQVFKFPSVERTTYDRLECTAQHQVFPLLGEKIVSDIKDSKLKVQASIQGEQVRVSGKNKDDLQEVIQLLRKNEEKYDAPLQFTNYR